jgi:hypothetical protein
MHAYLGGLPAWVGTCELRERRGRGPMGPLASRRRSGDVDELPPAEVDYSVRDRESTWAILLGNPAMGSDLALLTLSA